MGRKFIDCRDYPSDVKCSIAIVADSVEEVLEAAVLHVAAVHDHPDSPEVRESLRAGIKDGSPPP